MAFTVPNAVNYASPLNAVPLDWTSPPVEGAKGIQCSIQWNASQSGANKAVYVNCQNNATLNFSKIRALIVDNSQCGSDVEVIFPDTETTISVPAYTPYAIIPVFTNQTQFYVVSALAETTDKTSFTILNTAPPPIAVPTTQEQNFSTIGSIPIGVTGSQQIVAAGVNGTLEALSINGYVYGTAGGSTTAILSLQDGLGAAIWQGTISAAQGGFENVTLANLTDVRIRFQDGISLHWTTTGGGAGTAILSTNLYYRQP
jgi:hypothetical protein